MRAEVRKYVGHELSLEQDIEDRLAAGWTVLDLSTRKAWWSWPLGPFTRTQVHTVTFVKDGKP